ncbi:MAG: DeoR family transcriptional regulator [Candidatus Nealsonbacteria bacterium]|nr:DeoR family transcriptional regulator [Candidatus Nealsonbacteria bacterium]
MEKQELVQLTSDLYRLTLLFPKKEPLRYKMRELADDVLADILKLGSGLGPQPGLNLDIVQDLEILCHFFIVAREQNWVSLSDLLNVSERYATLKEELSRYPSGSEREDTAGQGPGTMTNQTAIDFNGSPKNIQRQDRILEILKEKGRAQVWEFKKIFPGVSKRTLRRDFEYLVSQNLVERLGEKNQTFYTSKIQVGHEVGQS